MYKNLRADNDGANATARSGRSVLPYSGHWTGLAAIFNNGIARFGNPQHRVVRPTAPRHDTNHIQIQSALQQESAKLRRCPLKMYRRSYIIRPVLFRSRDPQTRHRLHTIDQSLSSALTPFRATRGSVGRCIRPPKQIVRTSRNDAMNKREPRVCWTIRHLSRDLMTYCPQRISIKR